MKNNGFKFGHRNILGVFLALLALLMGACSEKDSVEEVQPPTMGPVKFSVTLTSPQLESSIIGYPAEGADLDTDFYSHFNEGASSQVFVKQNGKMYDLGDFKVERSENDNSIGKVTVDVKDVVTTGQPYDVYIVGGSYRYDNKDVYFRRNLTRKGGFSSWVKFSSSSIPTKVNDNINGTVEMLFVINKSGAPIKFKHKGFDVANRWYHTYGEVSIDNGTVTEYEDGKEVEGEVREVPVFTGENATIISSYYVPSGNKISEAQLIAEIDGKEVRSENRISSDLTIQINHSYAMFAIWDGEKLRMGDENGEAVVHVCSDDENSDIVVEEVKDDGTIVLSVSSNQEIKPGEIIVSGASEKIPYGLLRKVESATIQGGKVIVKTRDAYLNEVLPNAKIDMNIPFDNVIYHDGTRGAVTRGERDVDLLNLSKGIEISYKKPTSVSGIDYEMKGNGSVDLKTSCGIIYDAENGIPYRCGGRFEGSLALKLSFEASLGAEKTIDIPDFLDIDLMTATFWVGGFIPVSATFHFVCDAQIEVSGKTYFKWTPVEAKVFTFETHVIWNKEPDLLTGENWDCGCSGDNALSNFSWTNMFENLLNGLTDTELGLNGSAKVSLRPRLQARLYNNENIMVGFGVAPYVKAEGELAISYKMDKGLADDIELKDNLTLSVGAEIPIEGKVKFADFGAELPTTGPKSKLSLFEYQLVQGAAFFPVYNDFNVYPEGNVKRHSNVHISALKGQNALTWLAENEEDFGFCYAEVKKDNFGNELPREWTYISLWDKYWLNRIDKTDLQYTIETDIPTEPLETGKTFEVRPYSQLKVFGILKRKGGKFTTGGAVDEGGSAIIDVPGEDL